MAEPGPIRHPSGRPLRIVLVLWSGNVGGAETQSTELALALRGQGLDTQVIFVCNAQPLGERLAAADVPYVALDFPRGTRVFLAPGRLTRALRESHPDAVILAEGAPLAPLVRAACRRAAIIHVQHTGYFWYSLPRRVLELVGGVCRRIFADADVAVSDFVLETMSNGLHASRTVRIYNGVDLKRFRPSGQPAPRRRFVVGYAGRLGPGKGVEDLLAAAARLAPRQSFELRIAGAGPSRGLLQRLADDQLGPGVCQFVGQQHDMPAFWRGVDCAVVPSNGLVESFGMVAAEAMACGKVVVASRAGGLREVVAHGETGLLFEPGNIDALAECLTCYASESQLRARHGIAARARAERLFDIEVAARSYAALCESLVARRPA